MNLESRALLTGAPPGLSPQARSPQALLPGTLTGASPQRALSQALSPDELPAVEAEGGLAEEGGHELVSVDLVDAPPDRALPLPGELLKGLLLHRML